MEKRLFSGEDSKKAAYSICLSDSEGSSRSHILINEF